MVGRLRANVHLLRNEQFMRRTTLLENALEDATPLKE
jgi:hypothetical protein